MIYYLSYGKYESNLKKSAEYLVDIFPSSRQRLLANIEDLTNVVIQDSDEIEEHNDNKDYIEFDDVDLEQYHLDELDTNDSDFEYVEDNSTKDSNFELDENYEWNP